MLLKIKNGQEIEVRPYVEEDFVEIHKLNSLEGWDNLVARGEETKEAWENSNVAYVAELGNRIVGYVRGMTDKQITIYICEVLIAEECRGQGFGKELLQYVHSLYPNTRMEMLASSTSKSFYEMLGFRPFYGYRKTINE
jgi:ribosomal protein S18 acetylase RimI-like enzyme